MESEVQMEGEFPRATIYFAGFQPKLAAQVRALVEAPGLYDVRILRCVGDLPPGMYCTGSGVVLLDVETPGARELVAQLRGMPASLPIIALTSTIDYEVVVGAFRSGATDVLEVPVSEKVLFERLERAIREDRRRAPQRVLFWRVNELVSSLTPREREVMRCVVEGSANKQIAADLGISEKTVEVHRHKVMRKMEADSLAALVRMNVVMETSGLTAHPYSNPFSSTGVVLSRNSSMAVQ